jgi:hypothetical protein
MNLFPLSPQASLGIYQKFPAPRKSGENWRRKYKFIYIFIDNLEANLFKISPNSTHDLSAGSLGSCPQ